MPMRFVFVVFTRAISNTVKLPRLAKRCQNSLRFVSFCFSLFFIFFRFASFLFISNYFKSNFLANVLTKYFERSKKPYSEGLASLIDHLFIKEAN